MKPYSPTNLDDKKLLFNYQASRDEIVKENVFDALSFKYFLSRTCLLLETAVILVRTVDALSKC